MPEGAEIELRAPVFRVYGEDLDFVFTELRKKGCRRLIADGRPLDLAEDLVRQDEQVNCLNRECFRRAVEIGTDADRREWAMTMMLVSRALERIGDNAVVIGEQVALVVTGLFREFSDASHPGR